MKRTLFSLLLLSLFSISAHSGKIERITLAQLQSKAQLILLAKVVAIEKDRNVDRITIEVDSCLKGKSEQSFYTFTLVTRGPLKNFDSVLKRGDTGVFFLKSNSFTGRMEKAYWGSVALFEKSHFNLTKREKSPQER